MNKKLIITALLAIVAIGLVSCSSDNNYEDKVEQVTVYVSAETGLFYSVPNTTPEEGMMIRIEHQSQQIHGNNKLCQGIFDCASKSF